MEVFHFDRRTRVYRGRSMTAAVPVSRKPGRARPGQRAIPLNAVVNEPPHEPPPNAQWVVSHLDLSDRRYPRAIWRLQERDKTAAAPAASSPLAAPKSKEAVPADRMALLSLLLLLGRGKVRSAAKSEAETIIRAWIKGQGGMAEGRLSRLLDSVLAQKPVGGLTQ